MKTKTFHLTAPVPSEVVPPAPANSEATRRRLLERDARGKNVHQYTRSGETDLAATFRRLRREQEAAKRQAEQEKPHVVAIKKRA